MTFGLDRLGDALAWADVVVTATSSEAPVISAEAVAGAMEGRERPLVLVDLAVPADVERSAGDVAGARLFDVDDLRAGLDDAIASRLREVPSVETIVEDEVEAFARRYRELEVEPLLGDLRRRAEEIRAREVERTLRDLGDVDSGDGRADRAPFARAGEEGPARADGAPARAGGRRRSGRRRRRRP